jgi:hypothetical protein
VIMGPVSIPDGSEAAAAAIACSCVAAVDEI